MDAKPHNLKEIFDAQCQYLVPLYQRAYVWNQQDQWEPLWEDIAALADRYYREDHLHPHFIGAVVLEQLNTATGAIDLRQIIDGQQRLTTLQIVIEAACDICDSFGQDAANFARDLRRLTRNDKREEDPDKVFKVWPTNVDRDHFRTVMQAGSLNDLRNRDMLKSKGNIGSAIAECYLFFYNKISEWLAETDLNIRNKKLGALQNALYRGVLVVVIDLDEKDDAQMIFETLNARGTPLLASDLVKNYLLHRAEDSGHNLEVLYKEHWQFFDLNPFWRLKVPSGRMLRPQIELFMQHYTILLTRDDVIVTSLFNTFRQYVKDHPEIDPARYMKEMHHYGQIYQQFDTYAPESPEGLFFRRIKALENTTIYPLLLIIFDKLGKTEFAEQRRAILTYLESYLIRRMVCELSTKNYNNIFLDSVKRFIDCNPEQLQSEIKAYLLSQTLDINRWPNDEEFWEAWFKIEAYKRLKPQKRLRMILEGMEMQRRDSGKTEKLVLPKHLSIEHIMPTGWTDTNWSLPADTEEAKELRGRLIHTIGNLTLVTGPLNSSLSNDPWSKKVHTLQKHSILLLNADLQKIGEWNEASIQKRIEELFKLAMNVWPYPAN